MKIITVKTVLLAAAAADTQVQTGIVKMVDITIFRFRGFARG
jgi:hypothetical protein